MTVTRQCPQVRDLLDSYLSGELLVETNHAVLAHLSTCRACAAELERRQRLVELLRATSDVSPDVHALRTRIDAAIDREESWWSRVTRRTAIAAVFLAAGLTTFFLLRGERVDAAAYRDTVANHVECALTVPATAAYDPKRVARRLPAPFTGLAERLLKVDSPYRLIDGHACEYHSRAYVHFVFRHDGQTVSLFLDPHPRGPLPETPQTAMLTGGNQRWYGLELSHFHVVATASARHQVFVVSDAGAPRPDAALSLLAPVAGFVGEIER